MKRNPNESFEDYKSRRAASNFAVTQINIDAKSGNGPSARSKRLRFKSSGIKGVASSHRSPMGANIAASMAAKRMTNKRTSVHNGHLIHMAARKAERAAQAA